MIDTVGRAIRSRPRLSETYHGWWIVAAVTLLLTLGSGITFWTFTVYIPPLEDELGWSRAEISVAFSLGILISGLIGPFVGIWIDSHGGRSSILIGSVLTGACYLLLGTVDSLWQFYLIYGLSAVFRTFMFFIPLQSLLMRWFDRRRGLAMSIATSGFSLGGVIFLPLISLLVDAAGWRATHVISGVLLIAIFVPLTFLVLCNGPEGEAANIERPIRDETKPGSQNSNESSKPVRNWSLEEALHSRAFWLLSVAFMMFFMGRVSFSVHSVPFFESRDISAGTAAALISYSAVVSLVTRVFFGVLADRARDVRALTVGVSLLQVAAMAIVLAPTSPLVLTSFVLLWGTAAGGGPLLEPLLISRTFGARAFGSLLGALIAVETAGDFIGPILGGLIFDATGSYTTAFIVYIAGFVIAAIAFASFRPEHDESKLRSPTKSSILRRH